MTRSSTLAVVAGAFGAILLVAFFKGSVLGVMFGALLSPLPLAMAALGLGAAYLPVAVVGGAVTVMVLTGSFVLAVIYLVVDAAPVAMLTRMVWTTAPAGTTTGPETTTPDAALNTAKADAQDGPAIGRTLAMMMIGASGLIAIGLLTLPAGDTTKGDGGIEATLRAQIDEVIAAVPVPAVDAAKSAGGVDLATARAEIVRSLAGLIPGAAAWNWSLRALLSAALGQVMLKRMGLALWTTPAYRQVSLPNWFFLLLGGVAGAALVLKGDPGFIAGNTAVALCLPPVLQGLAVVHCGLGQLKHSRLALVVFYVAAALEPTIILAALVVAGVMDHFFQLRGRYMAPRTGGE